MAAPLSSARVLELASQAGFDLCGLAPAEPIPPQALAPWLEEGMHAEMHWMRERASERLDVTRLLPGARTVVALACNYYQEGASPIARYARGRDYHHTLKDRLRALRNQLSHEWPTVRAYAAVDTAPLMEKVWASRAGLGYVAKNGCLVTSRFGSYVVLAALVLDCEVDSYSNGPATERCGSCRLCLSACPTSAIGHDARVDARSCLSYHSIENPEAAPEKVRRAFSGVAFGCDRCQEVCPHNASPVPAGPRFWIRPLAALSLAQLAGLSPERHRQLVPGMAVARAKYDGLRRNAAYALGASKEREALPLLAVLAGDPSELVREAARWAVRQMGA
ncbi:MAG: tRNA epoxyqueuosine(34) reductase QueG [Myxococcales bacterium]|nr:tRNA epoxyqueuosine(34) reductase QueG [Myxococcales bacterium]